MKTVVTAGRAFLQHKFFLLCDQVYLAELCCCSSWRVVLVRCRDLWFGGRHDNFCVFPLRTESREFTHSVCVQVNDWIIQTRVWPACRANQTPLDEYLYRGVAGVSNTLCKKQQINAFTLSCKRLGSKISQDKKILSILVLFFCT